MVKRNYLTILNEKSKKDSEIAEALNWLKEYKIEMENLRDNLITENIELIKDIEKINQLVSFYRHEAITPYNAIGGFTNLILGESENLTPDQKEYLEYIEKSVKKGIGLIDFLNKDVFRKKENFKLEEIVKENINRQEETIRKNKLGINLRYNCIDDIRSYKGIIDGVVGTVLDDSYSWAPDYSRIDIGIRKDKGEKIELLVENKIGKDKRKGFGEGKGIGQKTAKEFIKRIGGEFHTYSKPEIVYNAAKNRYETMKKNGNERAINNISSKDIIYGVKIRL
jgi:signal transduction histidine kinase